MSAKSLLLRSGLRLHKFVRLVFVAAREQHYDEYHDYSRQSSRGRNTIPATLFSSIVIGAAITDQSDGKAKKSSDQPPEGVTFEAGNKRPDLPTFRAEEVSEHDSKSSFWVTYKYGVYDVTSFLPSHPGGDQIQNAAGLSIEPFWNVYGMHKTDEVFRLLETYRIGNLHDEDVVDHSDEELWVKEPVRSKQLLVKTARPFNAEVQPRHQIEHFDTPNELFYVRQHMPVPELDADSHKVQVIVKGGAGAGAGAGQVHVREFSLQRLRQLFPRAELRAALMCAGNRRSEMNQVKPVKGISWAGGAISNAVWGGVYLRDVLLHCGVDPRDVSGKHVILTGADIDATGTKFSTSIPLAMAMDSNARVVLATCMNGAPLPPDHGYPLRVVVPGAPAVRSVKWLESITISTEESESHWHQKDYRAFNPSVTWETADFSTAPPLYSLPVTSYICEPRDGDRVRVARDGCVLVRGYAYSGGGARIVRVDVTCDGGVTWHEAAARSADPAPHAQHYSWTLWEARVPVSTAHDQVELCVKATDSNFNTQPERFDDIWNIRGLLSNAYHRVTINLTR